MPHYFNGSLDGFELTDGGDLPEPPKEETSDSPDSATGAETATARSPQRPNAGSSRPATGRPSRPGIPPRPGSAPAHSGSSRATEGDSAPWASPAAPQEQAAAAEPSRTSSARPPAPARTRPAPVQKTTPVTAPVVDPIPTPTRIADAELEREYQERLSHGETYQPFGDLSTNARATQPAPDFTQGMAPDDISPQEAPEELLEKEEEAQREKASRFAVRRPKGTGDQRVKSKNKKSSKKEASEKKARAKSARAAEDDEHRENFSRYTGERRRVKWSMMIALAIIFILSALGVKQIFFPERIPSPEAVTNTVSQQLGFTDFPEELGMGWVSLFTEEYLTIEPDSKVARADRLAPFITEGTAMKFNAGSAADSKMTVSGGPFVSGVESLDDNRAVYTVSAMMNSGKWVYLKVPVYYDSEKNAFTVYESPSFIPRPQVADAPALEAEWPVDSNLSSDMQTHLKPFFEAWGASDGENLERFLLNDASVSARTGLQGAFEFDALGSVAVEAYAATADDEDIDPATNPMPERRATAMVTWADPAQETITYIQKYDLVIYQQPDGRWYVKDIDASNNPGV